MSDTEREKNADTEKERDADTERKKNVDAERESCWIRLESDIFFIPVRIFFRCFAN